MSSNTVSVKTWIRPGVDRRLKQLAARNGRSVASELRLLIEAHVAAEGVPSPGHSVKV